MRNYPQTCLQTIVSAIFAEGRHLRTVQISLPKWPTDEEIEEAAHQAKLKGAITVIRRDVTTAVENVHQL